MSGFDAFWDAYPNKVGKIKAREAYEKHVPPMLHATVMQGLENYKRHKPDYAHWAHASTWLNQQRWNDEYAATRQEHDTRPMPQYLRQKAKRPRLSGQDIAQRNVRMEVFDELRREGKDPYQVPLEEVRSRIEAKQVSQ